MRRSRCTPGRGATVGLKSRREAHRRFTYLRDFLQACFGELQVKKGGYLCVGPTRGGLGGSLCPDSLSDCMADEFLQFQFQCARFYKLICKLAEEILEAGQICAIRRSSCVENLAKRHLNCRSRSG